ncbi:hypothetical protein [Chitinophaga sp. Cy-1792]|uniref:hypothetical protein n=1 Tax=Chitinophaga sp. Cy-1792 TaxID=2608339 RepID=UPI00142324E6|nr:hypothetical protein [Chitinophaga sp. Cy-1792]NIG55494.1 hypothetical protein [Chitinophaga sp. Cy-1792]
MKAFLLVPMLLLATMAVAQEKTVDTTHQRVDINAYFDADATPLIVIDGKKVPVDSLKELNPMIVQGITIVKKQRAGKIYGEEGRMGAIEVETKPYIMKSAHDLLSRCSVKYRKIADCSDCLVYLDENGIVAAPALAGYFMNLTHTKRIRKVKIIKQPLLESKYKVSDKQYGIIVSVVKDKHRKKMT